MGGRQNPFARGSNTMFYVIIWIAPAKDAVFIAATNAAGAKAEKAGDEAVGELIRKYLPSVGRQ